MKKKYVVLVLVAVFFGMGMALLGWLSAREQHQKKGSRAEDGTGRPLAHRWELYGSLIIDEIIDQTGVTPQQAARFREILKEEFDSYRQWKNSEPDNSRQISLQERRVREIETRAWYDNQPPDIEGLEYELLVMKYGEKACSPLQMTYERIRQLLSEQQKEKFEASLRRIKKETSNTDKTQLGKLVDQSKMTDATKQLLKKIMGPHVSARNFHSELPMDILVDEQLLPLGLTIEQESSLSDISLAYRKEFRAELDRYYDQVAGQLPDLRTLCDAECYALQEGDVDSGQTFGNEIDEILNTDSLLQIFRATLDKVKVVLDDHQKQAFGPIRENALARFADYLDRSMTCENMRIVYEPCELPDATTQPGNPSTQPSPAG